MNKTRLSLYYLAAYLIFGGLSFALIPKTMLPLFFATGEYSEALLRLLGALLLALGIFVVQLIRLNLHQLYATTLAVRCLILAVLAYVWAESSDPLFLTLLAIVGLGFLLTGSAYLLDRRSASPGA